MMTWSLVYIYNLYKLGLIPYRAKTNNTLFEKI